MRISILDKSGKDFEIDQDDVEVQFKQPDDTMTVPYLFIQTLDPNTKLSIITYGGEKVETKQALAFSFALDRIKTFIVNDDCF